MTILETLIKLRDDLKLWVTNNLNTKADISYVDDQDEAILNTSKSYTDNAVAQKTQVQMITWEADD